FSFSHFSYHYNVENKKRVSTGVEGTSQQAECLIDYFMKSMFFIIIITYKKSPHERALNLINFANYEK
ncbi:hypothetical protein WAJ75_21105, partial [Acinetobacter baumannii]